jgi:hypothetical protein
MNSSGFDMLHDAAKFRVFSIPNKIGIHLNGTY